MRDMQEEDLDSDLPIDLQEEEVLEEPVLAPKDLIRISLKIVQAEIGKLSAVSASGKLDPQQARILTDYIKTLVVVDKNAKDTPEEDDVGDLTDEELIEEAKKAVEEAKNKKKAETK